MNQTCLQMLRSIIVIATIITASSCYGQEMKYMYNKVYLDGVPISASMAKEKSRFVSQEAFYHFNRAGKIRGWTYFWGILGGYELLAGANNIQYNTEIGLLDLGIGFWCVGHAMQRESKRRVFLAEGVKAYNSALEEE